MKQTLPQRDATRAGPPAARRRHAWAAIARPSVVHPLAPRARERVNDILAGLLTNTAKHLGRVMADPRLGRFRRGQAIHDNAHGIPLPLAPCHPPMAPTPRFSVVLEDDSC